MGHQCQAENAHQVAVMLEFHQEKITQAIIEALTIARQVAMKIAEAHIAHREAVAVVAASRAVVEEAAAEAEVVADVISQI